MSVTTINTRGARRGSLTSDSKLADSLISRRLAELWTETVAVWCARSGERLGVIGDGVAGDEMYLASQLRNHPNLREAVLLADLGPVRFVAIPIQLDDGWPGIATAAFAGDDSTPESLADCTPWCGKSATEIEAWLETQESLGPKSLLRLANSVQECLAAEARSSRVASEMDLVSENLATTYEEISLLYTITKNLRISSTDEELGRQVLERLGDCLPADAFAIRYTPPAADNVDGKTRNAGLFLTTDHCPVSEEQFETLIEYLELDSAGSAYVSAPNAADESGWPTPAVRQLIVVPLVEGENGFGWLVAFNHRRGESFGTVESNLLASLGTLLGIHCGNRELYRQQSDLLQNIVRALVSAIDAKDPYTSGHSDRVARFAVRIALEMRCNPKLLNTIYMAGLLHDIGKIGIDDNVLRKAGRLTELEFEHIKKHPELGYKILADLKQLADVLPAVLHHHERWDGKGYPTGLAGESIPNIARIMAVADSYDAMTSDRPYRRGMPQDKVDQIFRDGAGTYWDPEVVDAFFKAKEDIHAIAERERVSFDPLQQLL